MHYFNMTWDEVVNQTPYSVLIMLQASIPQFKSREKDKDKDQEEADTDGIDFADLVKNEMKKHGQL